MRKSKTRINEDLCQLCQDRKHNNIVTYDVATGEDLDCPKFLCDICSNLELIQNGWIMDQKTGNWKNSKFAEKNTGDVCTMCRAALHKQCEKQGCECDDCESK